MKMFELKSMQLERNLLSLIGGENFEITDYCFAQRMSFHVTTLLVIGSTQPSPTAKYLQGRS